MQDHDEPPLNPLPMVVWVLVLPMLAMEIVLAAGESGLIGGPLAIGWRVDAITRAAFVPDLWREMVTLGDFPARDLLRLISYPFVHGSTTHAVFGLVILLALGKFVAEVFRWWAVVAVFFVSAIGGVLMYGSFSFTTAPIYGAYPPVYGLIGAFTYIQWLRMAGTGSQYRAFGLIGMLLAAQLLFGVFYSGSWDWVADLAGFATGFLLSFAVAPGGIARLRRRIRQR